MKKARSLFYGELYGESDAAIIFFNFNHLVTRIWDFKSQSQGRDPKQHCHQIWVCCIQNDSTEHNLNKKTAALKVAIGRRNLH